MQWTDWVRKVKIGLIVVAVIIAAVSLFTSHFLVSDLSKEERNRMEVWAQALRVLNTADENTDLSLVLEVIQGNNTIPVVVLDSIGKVMDYRNINIKGRTASDTTDYVMRLGRDYYKSGKYIKVLLGDEGDYQLVCYDDSVMLKRLSYYPYIQLVVVLVFFAVAIIAILASKRAEQNRVWVGLSKETAHQLGTPISSLMAWMEILKETYPQDALLPEMQSDVQRLQLIADRFSKIGSLPESIETSLNEVVDHVIGYMDKRISKSVKLTKKIQDDEIIVNICPQLFEWVIENHSKEK